MKKIQYIAPAISITNLGLEQMLAESDENLQTTDTKFDKNVEVDVKRNNYNVWEDDWSK